MFSKLYFGTHRFLTTASGDLVPSKAGVGDLGSIYTQCDLSTDEWPVPGPHSPGFARVSQGAFGGVLRRSAGALVLQGEQKYFHTLSTDRENLNVGPVSAAPLGLVSRP